MIDRRRELGLRNEAERGAARHERAEIGAVEARGEDHPGRSVELGQSLGDLEPVEVRQLHVHDRHVRAVCLRLLDPTGAGFGFGHDDEAGPLEQLSRRSAEGAVVVDDENAPVHRLIVPAGAPTRGVASPTLSSSRSGASVVRVVTATGLTPAGGDSRSPPIGIAIGVAAAACATFGVVAIERGQIRDDTTAVAALTILAGRLVRGRQALSLGAAAPNG